MGQLTHSRPLLNAKCVGNDLKYRSQSTFKRLHDVNIDVIVACLSLAYTYTLTGQRLS